MISKVRKRRFQRQSYKKLLKQSIDVGLPFSDDQFKCEDKSVAITSQYKNDLDVIGRVVWKRPKEIVDIPHFLYREKLGPATQIEFLGKGPNEWFIAACCAIANHRDILFKVIPKSQIHFLHGILKFNFWNFGNWNKVVIDDKLPTFDNELIFSSSHDKVVYWVPLLEKAYAKLHGSYEQMAANGDLTKALMDLTGGLVETIPVNNDGVEREQFRLISEELDMKSIICAKTKGSDAFQSTPYGLLHNHIYTIINIKKPSSGTFRKAFGKDLITASIRIVNTIENPKKDRQSSSKLQDKLQDTWVSMEEFGKYFETITICRTNISECESIASGQSNSQFCFDIHQDMEEITIDLIQKTYHHFAAIGFKIYRVEINRNYKIHSMSQFSVAFSMDYTKSRNVFRRIKLDFGRYILIPLCKNQENDLLLRLYTPKVSNLRNLKQDMPRRNYLPFLSPKYPKFVTRIIMKSGNGLEKQDRFGSANPYCVIRCGRKAVKSLVLNDTLNPEWKNFSAIFYHERFVSIIIEIWHHSLLIDSFVGQVEVLPKIVTNDLTTTQQLELCGRKKGHKRPGSVKFDIFTSEDLRAF